MSSEPVAKHAFVSGYVHGVFFRATTRDRAEALGVTGWVRNVPGGVEVLAQGDPAAVEALLAWLHRGPPQASVSAVDTASAEFDDGLADFRIR